MRMNESLLFRIKNKPQKMFLLALVGFDDGGIRMIFPMGKPAERLILGETIMDPNGDLYIIKKMGLYSDVVWLEKIMDTENLAS